MVAGTDVNIQWNKDQDFQLTALADTMKVYYEDIGQVYLQAGRIRLSTTLSARNIEKDKKLIKEVVNNITELYKFYVLEDVLHEQLNEQMQETLEYIQIIEQWQDSTRKKRYLFGKVLQFIFGVNEEVYEDIEELGRHEEKIKKNQEHIHQIVLETIKEQAKNEEKLKEKALEIVEKVKHAMTDTTFALNQIETEFHLLILHNKASFIIDQTKKKYKNLVEPSITYNYLDIQPNITEMKITHKAKIKFSRNRRHFTSILEHDLYHKKPYKFFKITAIPHTINDIMVIPNLSGNYLAVREEEQEYFILTEAEFQTCTEEQEFAYVCSPQFLYSYLTPHCAMAGIYHDVPNECEYVKTTQQKLLFKHLLTQNAWIFSTPDQVPLQIICNEQNYNVTIWKTGILKVKQRCYLQLNGAKILGNDIREIKILNSFTQLRIEDTPTHISAAEIKPIDADFILIRHNEDFDIEPIERFQKHTQWSFIASFTTAITATVIVFWIIRYHWLKKKHSANITTPPNPATKKVEQPKPVKLRYTVLEKPMKSNRNSV